MNPITNARNLAKMNDRELEMGLTGTKSSWHELYAESAWIFVGGMSYDLSEGDVICVFSQYGEIVHINLIRDKDTGKSKGFGFICYEDQRSTILAVDNLNTFKLMGRTLRVDHVKDYKMPKEHKDQDEETKRLQNEGCAPKIEGGSSSECESEESDGEGIEAKAIRKANHKLRKAKKKKEKELKKLIKKEKKDDGYGKVKKEKMSVPRDTDEIKHSHTKQFKYSSQSVKVKNERFSEDRYSAQEAKDRHQMKIKREPSVEERRNEVNKLRIPRRRGERSKHSWSPDDKLTRGSRGSIEVKSEGRSEKNRSSNSRPEKRYRVSPYERSEKKSDRRSFRYSSPN